MNNHARNLRRLACALLALGFMALGANSAAWAAPQAAPAGQTVPTATPAPTAQPVPTTQPAPTAPAIGGTDGRCDVRPSDPPANAPRVVRELVSANTALTLLNCPWSAEIEAGDIAQDGTLEAKLLLASASQPPTAGERFFGPHVELTLFDTNGQPIASPNFASPITLCFSYTAADLAVIGDPAAFAIELFNPSTRQWERLPSTLDQANSRVCTQLPHLSLYALAARVPQPSSLPNTGAPEQPGTDMWVWALLALALGVGASIKAHALPRADAKPARANDD